MSSSVSSSTSPVKFDRILYNPGQHYSSQDGVYKVPYSGMYHIYTQLLGSDHSHLYSYLQVDGNELLYTFEFSSSSRIYRSATLSIVHRLEAGKNLTVTTGRTDLTIHGRSSGYINSWFGATLIYAD